ncbi:MAG TPA: hypothetical protein ENK96_06165 [Desulfobulbaceae bacterium]|nr:hypothetical protein [Desulfobulbaceae bacterium]
MLHEKRESLSKIAKQLEMKEEIIFPVIFRKIILFHSDRTTSNITVEDLSKHPPENITYFSWQCKI